MRDEQPRRPIWAVIAMTATLVLASGCSPAKASLADPGAAGSANDDSTASPGDPAAGPRPPVAVYGATGVGNLTDAARRARPLVYVPSNQDGSSP